MDKAIFWKVFGTVFVAEVGDKTQLATMLFAADRRDAKWTIFVASSLALVLAAAIGVAAGDVIGRFVAPVVLKWIAGIGFIVVGVWTIAKA